MLTIGGCFIGKMHVQDVWSAIPLYLHDIVTVPISTDGRSFLL
jgi:hypothetical protein